MENSNETRTPLANIYRSGFGNPIGIGIADDRGPHRFLGPDQGRRDALIWVGWEGVAIEGPLSI